MITIDELEVTPAMVELLKRWKDSEFASYYADEISKLQDYLTLQLGQCENEEFRLIVSSLQSLVAVKEELKNLTKVISANE
jgi:hypothetical protein